MFQKSTVLPVLVYPPFSLDTVEDVMGVEVDELDGDLE